EHTSANDWGNRNVAIGSQSGSNVIVGDNNTLIASYSDTSTDGISNATALGYQAVVSANNTIQLGNTSITNVKTSGTITAGAITLPNTDGTSGQVLATNGSGTVSWTTVGGGASDVTGLSDALIEDNSIYIGYDPSATTNTTQCNVALGIMALDAITTGDQNVALGYKALTTNTSGVGNTAVGAQSLIVNNGDANTANGFSSSFSNTSGAANTSVGYHSCTITQQLLITPPLVIKVYGKPQDSKTPLREAIVY
ncbi:MAG: hypothetical protein QM485_09590, partial [Flavobacteriaceae bacterium]